MGITSCIQGFLLFCKQALAFLGIEAIRQIRKEVLSISIVWEVNHTTFFQKRLSELAINEQKTSAQSSRDKSNY